MMCPYAGRDEKAAMTNGDSPAIELTTLHVRGAVDGDLNSLQWLVERFSPLLYAVAANRLGPALQASLDPADIVQDVWAAVLPKLGTLELRSPRVTPVLLSYLTTGVVNRIRDQVEKYLTQRLTRDSDDEVLEDLRDPVSGILTKAVRSEAVGRVHRALAELGSGDREIVIRRGLEQQPLSVVAGQLGIEPGTAAVRYHRAMKRLKERLPDSLFEGLEVADA